MSYLSQFNPHRTPQSEALPGQVPNSAGGYAFEVSDWERMKRFLILGSEGGSYYIGENKLTRENAQATLRCIEGSGVNAVNLIVEISQSGRAVKNDPAIFALALAASTDDLKTRTLALCHLSDVCRTGTHLFTFASYIDDLRGWGRALRRAVAEWYQRDDLAYQLVKYRQRGGWTHRDLLRLSHPAPNDLLAWAAGKNSEGPRPSIIGAFERAQTASSPRETASIVREYPGLPREALSTEHLKSVEVWRALLENKMPMTALIRNLATMTRIGLLQPLGKETALVCDTLRDEDHLRKARVHPLQILIALKTYSHGRSARGDNTWTPVPQITDALDDAFYKAFGNVQPTNKRTMLALDVSGSMEWDDIAGMPGVTPRVASTAMALVTAVVEPVHYIMAFSSRFEPINITPKMRLDTAMYVTSNLPAMGTDCSLPMMWALKNKVEVDTFIIYTDNETWAGGIHPVEALALYRKQTDIDARLAVVAMTSNGFSIADPRDPGMIDVVGFDTATPQALSEFAR